MLVHRYTPDRTEREFFSFSHIVLLSNNIRAPFVYIQEFEEENEERKMYKRVQHSRAGAFAFSIVRPSRSFGDWPAVGRWSAPRNCRHSKKLKNRRKFRSTQKAARQIQIDFFFFLLHFCVCATIRRPRIDAQSDETRRKELWSVFGPVLATMLKSLFRLTTENISHFPTHHSSFRLVGADYSSPSILEEGKNREEPSSNQTMTKKEHSSSMLECFVWN